MAKIMLFIDGTWLYFNSPQLSEAYGSPDFHVDFGKLPKVLAEEIGKGLGTADVDVVRTYLFGSYAANYDLRDEPVVRKRRDFFDMLKEEYHYEVEVFPVNFSGRRIRRSDRDPADSFEPKEKCVDIALATTMLHLAATPYAYDIAIAVMGDRDFVPMLQSVRRLGKRVAIASIKSSCAPELSDPRDEARVKDFDIIWIEDLLQKLELKYERHQLQCESPMHKGERLVWTTYHPRKGKKFYCEACLEEFTRQRATLQRETGVEVEGKLDESEEVADLGKDLSGTVSNLIRDRGFGFIMGSNGRSYFFHISDIAQGDFQDLQEGDRVQFEIKRQQNGGKAGAAQNVKLLEE